MLPFRFGVYAAVAPTMSAWRDRARMAEGFGYSTLYVSDHLDAQFGRFPASRGATGGLRDIANGVQARALPCDGDPG
jgi:alkanesulfonate monooxygenase SsuD/methylene tetrahydromethanopterin reductase-like flavin-dependent oxidoreductase (luciferase family)